MTISVLRDSTFLILCDSDKVFESFLSVLHWMTGHALDSCRPSYFNLRFLDLYDGLDPLPNSP